MFETKEIYDVLPAAYLRTLNFSIRPKRGKRKVSFIVSGEYLTEALETFYSNPHVRIMDFCNAYRELRGMIFNLKDQNPEHGDNANE
jgi:hypothetical protein